MAILDDSMVWTIEDDKVKIKYADYLPDIPANDFIKEMLKFPCATLFIKGNTYIIELNKNILRRKATKDWSDRLEDGYSISIKRGEDYIFAVTQDKAEDVPAEREKIKVESIQEMITHLDTQKGDPDGNNIFCYEVNQTEQIFEAMPEPNLCTETETHWKLKLLAQSPTKDIERDSLNDKGTFDMTPTAKVCKSVVVDYFCSNQSFQPSFENGKTSHIKCVMPEVEINTKEPTRTSDMIVGLWNGKQFSPRNSSGKSFIYPLISHSNYMPDGSKRGEVSLTIADLSEQNHKEYKDWNEKDKIELIGNVRLSPKDLNQLDLRDKTYLLAKEFLTRKLNVVLKMRSLEPAKIEFVEG